MEDSDMEPLVDNVLSWCWNIIKRRLGPDAALFVEGDMYLKLSSKYIPLDIQKDLQTNSVQEFPCGIASCNQMFSSVSKYETHYNSFHRNVCQTCHRILPSAHLLEIHILEAHDVMFALQAEKQDMFQCLLENCSKKFKDTAARRDHMVKIHKYPSNYRYDRHKHKSTPKKKGVGHRNGDTVAMEIDPAPVSKPVSSEIDQLNTRSEEKVSSGRIFSHKVPKNICFGQGVSRGFLGGRGRGRGKHSNKKHWHNKGTADMDTAVDIETVDMSELSSALS
ncbi:zinc finger protein 511-like [Mercenaria mercenaria]|uniref:zinc finger protein 511-like n=1 Tax=Mercenaria mercenaria TaxID=6596 RepID=UPI00234E7645|nr:zinc finger protein 511-like [Mercenaria mercenaria]